MAGFLPVFVNIVIGIDRAHYGIGCLVYDAETGGFGINLPLGGHGDVQPRKRGFPRGALIGVLRIKRARQDRQSGPHQHDLQKIFHENYFTGYNREMVSPSTYISASEDDTARLAQQCAADLKPGDILCLYGDLGMGKSVFARALIRHLAGDPALEVPSPTFTLVQTYDTPRAPLWHFDLYRLKDPEEVYELGWEEALGEAICLIEWPERLGPLLPATRIDIHLSLLPDGSRQLQVTR